MILAHRQRATDMVQIAMCQGHAGHIACANGAQVRLQDTSTGIGLIPIARACIVLHAVTGGLDGAGMPWQATNAAARKLPSGGIAWPVRASGNTSRAALGRAARPRGTHSHARPNMAASTAQAPQGESDSQQPNHASFSSDARRGKVARALAVVAWITASISIPRNRANSPAMPINCTGSLR